MANVRMNFSGNSHKSREKRVKAPVTKGKVSTETQGKGFWDSFFEDDWSDIWEYIKEDVLKPAIKNLLYDTVAGSFDRALFGGSSHSRRRGSNEITNYSGRYKHGNNSSRRNDDTWVGAGDDYKDIKFEERGDAEEVLDTLCKLIKTYGQATIGDFYDAAGVTPNDNFTKNEEYGWDDLSRTSVRLARGGGYYIDFPKERYVNN